MLVVITLLCVVIAVCVKFSYRCYSLSGQLYELVRTTPAYDAVMFHVYRLNNNGTLPLRGRLVAKDVVEFAKMYSCPVCITIGEASEQDESDSLINATYLRENGGANIEIVLGEDATVCTTYEEVREFVRLAKVRGCAKILVVGELPHLPRIVKYWKQVQSGLDVHYWGTRVPWYYYLNGMFMVIAEILLPVGTRRRNWCLKLAHRGPKKKKVV